MSSERHLVQTTDQSVFEIETSLIFLRSKFQSLLTGPSRGDASKSYGEHYCQEKANYLSSGFDMNCATLTPAITPDNYQQQQQLQRTLERERRTSRGLTACLRGEREEVESKFVDIIQVCYFFVVVGTKVPGVDGSSFWLRLFALVSYLKIG